MTNTERVRAFAMRLNGANWEKIGHELGYSGNSVRDDLFRCIRLPPRQPNVIYPVIRDYIAANYGGVVRKFALDIGCSYNTTYSVLTGRVKPSKPIIDAVCRKIGATPENAFREDPL